MDAPGASVSLNDLQSRCTLASCRYMCVIGLQMPGTLTLHRAPGSRPSRGNARRVARSGLSDCSPGRPGDRVPSVDGSGLVDQTQTIDVDACENANAHLNAELKVLQLLAMTQRPSSPEPGAHLCAPVQHEAGAGKHREYRPPIPSPVWAPDFTVSPACLISQVLITLCTMARTFVMHLGLGSKEESARACS